MEGIIFLIIIGLISKFFPKIKELIEEKGFEYPGMPPFPKGQTVNNKKYDDSVSDDEFDEYDVYEDYDNEDISKSKIEKMEKVDQHAVNILINENYPKGSKVAKTEKQNEVYTEVNTELKSEFKTDDYIEDIFHIDNVKRGIIWQEILEEPRARRPFRRI